MVAPATAHVIARYAMGLSDDLLTATLLASRAPVLLCPAMHTEMWEQPSVQENLATLRRRGVMILEPEDGALAGGDSGKGRLPDPEVIASLVLDIVNGRSGGLLRGRRVVISAGGTREAIDPVRVITNRSSGKQGYAIAEVAARLGAEVILVSTSSLTLAPDVVRSISVITVSSAAEMADVVLRESGNADVVIMAAAVADFTVATADRKLKKDDGVPTIELVPTQDILLALGHRKRPGQIIVGFAAETNDVLANAQAKLLRKGCDFLVANDVSADGVGFDHATNEVVILSTGAEPYSVAMTSKEQVAYELLSKVAERIHGGTHG